MRRGTAAGNLHMHGALGRPYDRPSTVHAALKYSTTLLSPYAPLLVATYPYPFTRVVILRCDVT